MRVDIHAGFTQRHAHPVPPPRLVTYAGVCQVDRILVVNRDAAASGNAADMPETDANVACLEACVKHPVLLPIYWLRPGRIDSHVHALAGALAEERFVATYLDPEANSIAADDARLDAYLEVLVRTQRVLLVETAPQARSEPGRVYALARRHPELPIVLLHGAADAGLHDAVLGAVSRAASQNDARLYLDTAFASAPSIGRAVEAVGVQRVLFGSAALAYGDAHVPRHIAFFEELRLVLNEPQRAQVLGGNAVELFGLRTPAKVSW